ncbi:pathogenesis-related protein 5-like [Pyrus ussuriensis x Pyrus communis]|uniref:Pathogenesis-related protein 5-like n=1 Tax=Pyrus ussuriensis x Pyrus communis TaxID=2448454 RepID=A0A5N5GNS5_9ROSA|nr:pathogenesis-related protein 5-like [Pyrus ussuriensis x Pyrus communis]
MTKRFNMLILMLLSVFMVLSGPKLSESARTFTVINNCKETVWPAVTPGDNFNGGGFVLKPGQSMVFTARVSWSGRIWGRTGCNFDKNGNGSCETGSCGSTLQCVASGKPPAMLTEFTLAAVDFYDVILVTGSTCHCVSGCDGDLRPNCPNELAVKANGKKVGCRSVCDVFDTDEYCCKGRYGNAAVCNPTYYSKKFKEACLTAFSYAYDDPSSSFTCSGTDYVVAFCSTRKRPMCTYRHHKIPCPNVSGSVGLKSLRWWAVMLGLLMMINLWINF